MAELLFGFLLDNIKQEVLYRKNLISNAEVELNSLEKELKLIKCKLEDASKEQKTDETFKAWVKQIREVVYEVEDTIDTHMIIPMAAKSPRQKLNLAKHVERLRKGPVKMVFDQELHFFNHSGVIDDLGHRNREKGLPYWRAEEPKKRNIVGLEYEMQTLNNYLKEDSEKLQVVSVIGMAGLGKTTLASEIFYKPEVQFKFQIWVSLSNTLNTKDVFLSILKKLTNEEFSMNSDDELALMVRERLDRGKFLIIFDDLWTREAWDQIKVALPMHNGEVKVLITTRISKVASHAMTTRAPIKLGLLNEKKSWELLQNEVNNPLIAVDTELANVGRLIAKKCNGLPLTIVVIAKILSDKMKTAGGSTPLIREEWDKFCVSVTDHLLNEDKQGKMLETVALSYRELCYNLRNCFLYFGMFPEGATIPAWQLTRLWIAEGFIQPMSGYSLEEIAENNLKDLISRSLVMVHETKVDDEIKTCGVHDIIRLFCVYEAARENIFQEIIMDEKEGHFARFNFDWKIESYRRLSVHSKVPNLFSRSLFIPTRSILCFPDESLDLEPTDIGSVEKSFGLLRVFAAEKIKFSKFPSKMTKLVHLQYLTLSVSSELDFLPDSIFNLRNLQTLIVETLSSTLEIKADIWKLMQLRHFKTKASINLTCKNTNGQGGENLKTFGRLSSESCTNDFSSKAKNLNALAVRGELSEMLLHSHFLEELNILNKLKLEHDAYIKPLHSLPEPRRFPQNLMNLTLTGTYLTWANMSTLGKLCNLEVLKLKENAFVGKSWEVNVNGFSKLEILYIDYTDLVSWTVTECAFPKLTSLTLKNCELLKELPSVLGVTLMKLSLEYVSQAVVSSAKTIENLAKQTNLKVQKRGFKLVIGALVS